MRRLTHVERGNETPRGIVGFWLLALLLCAGTAAAQSNPRPLLDGFTVAPGVGIYVGDLDGNPDANPIQYFVSGRFGMILGADRRYGNISTGIELHYNSMAIDRGEFELRNTILSLDLVAGYHFDIFRSDFVRLLGGLGATYVMPSYERFPEDLEGAERLDARLLLTVPVSLIIQERVRLGVRLTQTDLLDSFKGQAGVDWLYFVHVGYRFQFNR